MNWRFTWEQDEPLGNSPLLFGHVNVPVDVLAVCFIVVNMFAAPEVDCELISVLGLPWVKGELGGAV